MKFEIERYGIKIIPENEEDEAYIEDTLGVTNENHTISLYRVNLFGMHSLAYLSTSDFGSVKSIRARDKLNGDE